MTATRPPDDTDRSDEIKQRYLQASAEQNVGPSERVKRAALAHAQTVALAAGQATQVAATAAATRAQPTAIAANRPRWNVPLVVSLAIASISALLALQFDRSDPADQQIVLGTPSATTPTGTATRALPPQEPIALPTQEPRALPPQEPVASEQEKLGLPAQQKSPAVPASSPLATKKAKSAVALDRQSTMTVPAPAPASSPASPPAAEPAYVPEPPPAVPRPAPQPSAVAPTGRNAATAKPPVAGSEFADADKSIESSARGAAQSKAAPSANAEQSPQAGARSEARPAASSSATSAATSAAIRGRAAPAAQPAPATASAPSLAPSLTPPTTPSPTRAAPPFDAGLALREAARTGQLTLLVEAVRSINTAQLNSTDNAGRTALMLATLGGHVEVVERLLAAGADTELKDTSGQTAAQMAKRLGYQQIESALKKR